MNKDIISPQESVTLPGLFDSRLARTPDSIAYRYFSDEENTWSSLTWHEMAHHIRRWASALHDEKLQTGERVAIMLRNCPQWVMFDQASLRSGMVTVPLYTNDRAENIAYIIEDAQVKVLFIEGEAHWHSLKGVYPQLDQLQRIITLHPVTGVNDNRVVWLKDWLNNTTGSSDSRPSISANDLATIVYTSGTTGKPKGVMLSHGNVVWNAYASTQCIPTYPAEVFLSFLPLSHMLERTIGYYFPMTAGSTVCYARSIEQLAEDLVTIRPNVLISVPRIYERVNNKIEAQLAEKSVLARKLYQLAVNIGWQRFLYQQQRSAWHPALLLWPLLDVMVARKVRDKLGGRLRFAISGGAPLASEVAKVFISLGMPISQGYGLTETSPVLTANRLDNNYPDTVGEPLDDVEVRLGQDNELQVRSPGVMLGYWQNPEATAEVFDEDGWFRTGDKAEFNQHHVRITGRLKDIIVLSNGEKIPPADIELAIATHALFEQVLVVGEGRSFLSAIIVLNPDKFGLLFPDRNINECMGNDAIKQEILELIRKQLVSFPGYTNIYKVHLTLEPWTIDNGLITPTLKLKRNQLMEKFSAEIDAFYAGH